MLCSHGSAPDLMHLHGITRRALADSKGLNLDDRPDADLSKSKAKSRSGHRNAGNKQINDEMKSDPNFRADMENRHGSDVFDRTSTSGSGRRLEIYERQDRYLTKPEVRQDEPEDRQDSKNLLMIPSWVMPIEVG